MPAPNFPNLRFTYSFLRSPGWKTLQHKSAGGKLMTLTTYSMPLYEWELDMNLYEAQQYDLLANTPDPNSLIQTTPIILSQDKEVLEDFYNLMNGAAGFFYLLDPTDYKLPLTQLALGDGNNKNFQAVRKRWTYLETIQSLASQNDYATTVLTDTPVSYYRLMELATATTCLDQGSLATNATVIGSPTFWSVPSAFTPLGDLHYVPTFAASGTVNAVRFAPAGGFPTTAPVTFECWLKTAGASLDGIVDTSPNSGTAGRIYTDGTGINWTTPSGTTVTLTWASLTKSPGNQAWHHLVVTFTYTGGNKVITAYLDNVNVGSTSSAQPNGTVATDTNCQFGNRGNVAAQDFAGNLQDCAWYNVALTPTQIGNHYTKGTQLLRPGIWAPFDLYVGTLALLPSQIAAITATGQYQLATAPGNTVPVSLLASIRWYAHFKEDALGFENFQFRLWKLGKVAIEGQKQNIPYVNPNTPAGPIIGPTSTAGVIIFGEPNANPPPASNMQKTDDGQTWTVGTPTSGTPRGSFEDYYNTATYTPNASIIAAGGNILVSTDDGLHRTRYEDPVVPVGLDQTNFSGGGFAIPYNPTNGRIVIPASLNRNPPSSGNWIAGMATALPPYNSWTWDRFTSGTPNNEEPQCAIYVPGTGFVIAGPEIWQSPDGTPTSFVSKLSSSGGSGSKPFWSRLLRRTASGGLTVLAIGAAANLVQNESLGTGNGTATTFSGTLAHPAAIAHSISISATLLTIGLQVAVDDGAGHLVNATGYTGIVSGTINYATGAWSITYSNAVVNGGNINGTYGSSTLPGTSFAKSTDGGLTWTAYNQYSACPIAPGLGSFSPIHVYDAGPDLWWGTDFSGSQGGLHLYNSPGTDGVNWGLALTTPTNEYILGIARIGSYFYAYGYNLSAFASVVWRSADNGATWTRIGLSGSSPCGWWRIFGPNDTLLVGVNLDGNTYKSTDHGATWTATGTWDKADYSLGVVLWAGDQP